MQLESFFIGLSDLKEITVIGELPVKKLMLQRFGLTGLSTYEGAASSRDKRWQHGATEIIAAGSRSHQVKAIFLQYDLSGAFKPGALNPACGVEARRA